MYSICLLKLCIMLNHFNRQICHQTLLILNTERYCEAATTRNSKTQWLQLIWLTISLYVIFWASIRVWYARSRTLSQKAQKSTPPRHTDLHLLTLVRQFRLWCDFRIFEIYTINIRNFSTIGSVFLFIWHFLLENAFHMSANYI